MLGLGTSLITASPISLPTIGTVTLTAPAKISDLGNSFAFSVSNDGDLAASDLTYQWEITNLDQIGAVISSPTSSSTNIAFYIAGFSFDIQCTVSNPNSAEGSVVVSTSMTLSNSNSDPVINYVSDFSGGVDSWVTFATTNSGLGGNRSIGGRDEVLQWNWTADEGDTTAWIRRTMDTSLSDQNLLGTKIAVSFSVYYNDADSNVSAPISFTIAVGGFSTTRNVVVTNANEWTDIHTILTPGVMSNDLLQIGIINSGDIPTQGDNINFSHIRLSYLDGSS